MYRLRYHQFYITCFIFLTCYAIPPEGLPSKNSTLKSQSEIPQQLSDSNVGQAYNTYPIDPQLLSSLLEKFQLDESSEHWASQNSSFTTPTKIHRSSAADSSPTMTESFTSPTTSSGHLNPNEGSNKKMPIVIYPKNSVEPLSSIPKRPQFVTVDSRGSLALSIHTGVPDIINDVKWKFSITTHGNLVAINPQNGKEGKVGLSMGRGELKVIPSQLENSIVPLAGFQSIYTSSGHILKYVNVRIFRFCHVSSTSITMHMKANMEECFPFRLYLAPASL